MEKSSLGRSSGLVSVTSTAAGMAQVASRLVATDGLGKFAGGYARQDGKSCERMAPSSLPSLAGIQLSGRHYFIAAAK